MKTKTHSTLQCQSFTFYPLHHSAHKYYTGQQNLISSFEHPNKFCCNNHKAGNKLYVPFLVFKYLYTVKCYGDFNNFQQKDKNLALNKKNNNQNGIFNLYQCNTLYTGHTIFGTVTNKSLLVVENEHFRLLQGPYYVWQLPVVTFKFYSTVHVHSWMSGLH